MMSSGQREEVLMQIATAESSFFNVDVADQGAQKNFHFHISLEKYDA